MKRLGRVLLTAILLVAAAGVGELVTPRNAFACSCARLGTIAALVGDPGVVVVSGRITDLTSDRFGQRATFAITRRYQGVVPGAVMPIRGGGGADCTVDLRQAVDVVMVAEIVDGTIVPGLCAPFGDLSTPEGRQLLAEVDAAFGPAATPPAPVAQRFDPVLIVVVIVTPFIALIAIIAIVALLRRRDARSEVP